VLFYESSAVDLRRQGFSFYLRKLQAAKKGQVMT